VFLVVIGGFWRLRIDGFVSGGGGFPADSFLDELFLCLFVFPWTVCFVRLLT
jgi:hypothetical protein